MLSDVDTKHFYVTLLSNSSKNLYRDNMIGAFTAELARPVEVGYSDNWVVGVRLNTRQSFAILQA